MQTWGFTIGLPFADPRASVHLKVCDYKTLVYFYHQKLTVSRPWSLFQTESEQEGFQIFLKHSWQLSFLVILPLSLMTRQTPWLAVSIQGYLSSCWTYSSFTESEGLSRLSNLAVWMGAWIMTIPNIDMRLYHLTSSADWELQSIEENFDHLTLVLTPSGNASIILSVISSCFSKQEGVEFVSKKSWQLCYCVIAHLSLYLDWH